MLIADEAFELEVKPTREYDAFPARLLKVVLSKQEGASVEVADQLSIPPWGRLLIKCLLWAIPVILAGFGGIYWQIVSLSHDIGKVEGKIDQIPASIAQKMIVESKKSLDSGSVSDASRYLQLSTSFLDDAMKAKAPANSAFFEDTYVKLNQLRSVPQLASEYQNARIQLATYRSVLQPIPNKTGKETELKNPTTASELKGEGTVLVMSAPGDFITRDSISRKLDDMVGVEDMTLVGGVAGVSQALDGIRWKNVNFVNIHIRYEGAEVLLSNVRFVNCTFDIVNDHRGELVTDYAILSVPKSLVISQSVASSFIPQLDQRFPQPVLLPKPEAMPFGTLRASTQSGSEETPK